MDNLDRHISKYCRVNKDKLKNLEEENKLLKLKIESKTELEDTKLKNVNIEQDNLVKKLKTEEKARKDLIDLHDKEIELKNQYLLTINNIHYM